MRSGSLVAMGNPRMPIRRHPSTANLSNSGKWGLIDHQLHRECLFGCNHMIARMTQRLRLVASIAIVLAALALVWMSDGVGPAFLYFNEDMALTVLLACTLLYVLLMAMPFVPGMELGWLLMGVFGIPGILAAWLGTVAGLVLGFTMARHLTALPMGARLALQRNSLVTSNPADLNVGVKLLQRSLIWQQNHPYIFLLAALNLPGNLIIGGGGGIAWISGFTPGMLYRHFIPVAALATSGVPLILLFSLWKN